MATPADTNTLHILPSMVTTLQSGKDIYQLPKNSFKNDLIEYIMLPKSQDKIKQIQGNKEKTISDISEYIAADYTSTFSIIKNTFANNEDLDPHQRSSVLIHWQRSRRDAGKIWSQITQFQGLVEDEMSPQEAYQQCTQVNRNKTYERGAYRKFNEDTVTASNEGKMLIAMHKEAKFKRDILSHLMAFKQEYYNNGLTKHPLVSFDLMSDVQAARNGLTRKALEKERSALYNSLHPEERRMPKNIIETHEKDTIVDIQFNNKHIRGRMIDSELINERTLVVTVNTPNASQIINVVGPRAIDAVRKAKQGEGIGLSVKLQDGVFKAPHAYTFSLNNAQKKEKELSR